MKIEEDVKLDFSDVLIKPKRSETASRASVNLYRQFKFKYAGFDIVRVPIIASNMDSTGTLKMADTFNLEGCMVALHKFYQPDDYFGIPSINEYSYLHRYDNFFTIGIQESELEKLDILWLRQGRRYPNLICIDVANGYTQQFVNFVRKVREKVGDNSVIMAGNVATPEMTQELIINGKADIIKIGIGPGSVCTTRLKTGIGYPQLSAIAECADVAHGLDAHICADGGCKNAGDVAKAFGAGADFVMLGGILAGTEECEGKWTYEREFRNSPDTKASLKFHGMSSREAMEQHNGGVADYKTAEGIEITVPYKGPAITILKDILGGLRSTCAYIGAESIKDLPKACTFVRVNRTKEYLYEI